MKNYVQKDLENEKYRLRNDGKISKDGDVSTAVSTTSNLNQRHVPVCITRAINL